MSPPEPRFPDQLPPPSLAIQARAVPLVMTVLALGVLGAPWPGLRRATAFEGLAP